MAMARSPTAVPLGVYLTSGSRVRFPIRRTLLRLAAMGNYDAALGRDGLLFQVKLAIDNFVQSQLCAQELDLVGCEFELHVDVKAAVEIARHALEALAVHLLRSTDFAAEAL